MLTEKQILRLQLHIDQEIFLAQGGKIQRIEPREIPRNTRVCSWLKNNGLVSLSKRELGITTLNKHSTFEYIHDDETYGLKHDKNHDAKVKKEIADYPPAYKVDK